MESEKKLDLWPAILPFEEDFLPAGHIHKIRYALYGNPEGEPVFFLHGGPGGGCSDDDARWFDPSRYLIVIHDQRGSGKSTPLAEIKDNTPSHLVSDIEKLREYLNIKIPFSIFGGSWGSTLALLYAEAYPQNILRMILRGIFSCSYDEQDYFYSAGGAARFSPEAWENLIKSIPAGKDRIQERIHKLIENSDEDGKLKWCRTLAEYEYSFFNLPKEELNNELANIDSVFPEMRLNMYYQANRFFIKDKQILNNVDLIKHIPITIIQGDRDIICPPVSAWKLHRQLENSKLILVPGAGHLSSEPGIQQALLEVLKDWK